MSKAKRRPLTPEELSRAKRILALREASGLLSSREVSLSLGYSATWLWQVEKGRSRPSAAAIEKLAHHYGVTTDYIYTGPNDEASV